MKKENQLDYFWFPWYGRKGESLVWKERLYNWSLINRQGYKDFNGLDPRGSSSIGREKERATWEECNLKVAGTLGGSPL